MPGDGALHAAARGCRRLLLARHGQTAWNAEGRFQGQADPPLDTTGRAQAERLAADVRALRLDGLVSSDLLRARQTAMLVSRACGVQIQVDRALREVDLGGWEGLYPHQAAERFPEEYRQWSDGRDLSRGGGETEAQAGKRAATALLRIAGSFEEGATVLIIGHGLALKAAMGVLARNGMTVLAGAAPHLGNGQWVALELAASVAG
jgi:probable phosphoglycerate mutase